jgi:hypothetical protein
MDYSGYSGYSVEYKDTDQYTSDIDHENPLNNYSILSNNEELFLFNHANDILDMYDDLNKRFALNPDFLCKLKNTHFANFLIDIIIYNNAEDYYYHHNIKSMNNFEIIFEDELLISYNIVSSFIKQMKGTLEYDIWKSFCFKHSFIPFY